MNRERSGSSSELLETLTELETELHRLETRRNASRLEALLHPDFAEFGRSGRVFAREDVLSEFAEVSDCPRVVAKNFEVRTIGDDAALLTYVSAHEATSGHLHRATLRSSLWLHGPRGWQLLFHQGTPADH
jgi:hypothetical protein